MKSDRKTPVLPCTGTEKLHLYEISWKLLFRRKCPHPFGKNRNKIKAPRHLSREARLYINISTYVTTGNREGFERWAKLNNLKEAARTFNYLSENNLLNYEDFQQHVSDVDASVKAADQRITQINSELSTQKIIQKHCDSYRLCRKVIEDCKSAKIQKHTEPNIKQNTNCTIH